MLTRVEAFEKLRANLELTGLQEKTVAERQANVRAIIEQQLTVADSFLSGSYQRKTLISPLNQADVDVMIVLDRRYRSRGPRSVLDLLRFVLVDEYPRTRISRNGQAVTIRFSDFAIDVVPAFRYPAWHWREGWEICDSGSNSWIATNPKADENRSARGNQVHGGNLVPRIKQLKAWNRTCGEPLRSFHLETMAWAIFGTSWWSHESIQTDWDAARLFFKKAPRELTPALPGIYDRLPGAGAYLEGERLRAAISEVRSAYDRCRQAEVAAKDGDMAAMHMEYGAIFGNWYRH